MRVFTTVNPNNTMRSRFGADSWVTTLLTDCDHIASQGFSKGIASIGQTLADRASIQKLFSKTR